MKRLWMAGLLVAGAAFVLPAESSADWRLSIGVGADYGHGPRRGGPAFRYGYDRGWREGSEEGHSDGRRSRDPRFWREGEYRDADRGYKRWMGPRGEYAAGFREGYQAGYRRAYVAARPDRRWRERDRDRWESERSRYDDRYRDDHR
jgi:hypothetical protein